MASYQARQRDPLLDQGMQAALERRGKELLGALLLGLGLIMALILGSYSPDDPSWLAHSSTACSAASAWRRLRLAATGPRTTAA